MTISPGRNHYPARIISGILLSACALAACNIPKTYSSASVQEDSVPSGYWAPQIGDDLQIQFSGDFEFHEDVEVYDLDLFDTTVEIIEAIHARGKRVLCYINVGAWEDWRPDATQYPSALLGNDYEGWPGEKWLDIRRTKELNPLISARFDLCREKGFDGVEPDNLDGYQNETGFELSADDQLEFNLWLTKEAHKRGLSIGLKNDPDQINQLATYFDFAILEDCFPQNWCMDARLFIENNKPVFAIEYTDLAGSLDPYCRQAEELGYSIFLKNRELDGFRGSCD